VVEVVENFSQVIDEGGAVACRDFDVINVDLDVAANLLHEAVLHHTLVRGTRIFEPERHRLVTENAVWCDEGCLFFVFNFHPYLVLA